MRTSALLVFASLVAAPLVAAKRGTLLGQQSPAKDVTHGNERACNSIASCIKALQQALPLLTSLPSLSTIVEPLLASPIVTSPSALTPQSQWCPNSSYFEFFPAPVAVLPPPPSSSPVTWTSDNCFTSVTATNVYSAGNFINITITGSNPTSLLCDELLAVATSYGLYLASIGELAPSTTISIPLTSTAISADVSVNGLSFLSLPCGLVGTIQSILKTINLFSGTDLAASNIDFLTERKVWPPVQPFNKTVAVAASTLKSGDYLAIARLDGLDPMVMFGTGGVTGHSALAVWRGDQLYVSESTDANPFGPVYWPPPYGIITHKYEDWVPLAVKAGYHVGVLPVTQAYADSFNETAYWNWFESVQGMPYGYHSMLFSFLDTYAPFANLPLPVSAAVITPIMNMLDPILGNATAGVSVYSMLTWGLNKRMGTNCSTLACIIAATVANKIAGRPIQSFVEAAAMVDNDSWKFGANYSMVCSEFAAHGWKVGLADAYPVWNNISSNEQTPKDNYQMNMYDPARFNDSNCPGGVHTTPAGAYCQLMGQYILNLNDYNTVPVYAGVNNACPAQWPTYVRCPANNPSCC